MKQKDSFQKILGKIENEIKVINEHIQYVRFLYNSGRINGAYKNSLQMALCSEKFLLLVRQLPAYFGIPTAQDEVEKITRSCVPINVGFTAEGWFSVQMPFLLPEKKSGSVEYVRSILYPVMRDFFETSPPVRYTDCVVIFRHVYEETRSERRKRDHDNMEIKMVTDIVALYVMPDDAPGICNHYHCSVKGTGERTEVYVVPKEDFLKFLTIEKTFPGEGVKLYEIPFFADEKQV